MGEPEEVLDELIEPVIVGDALGVLDVFTLEVVVFVIAIVLENKELAVGVLDLTEESDKKGLELVVLDPNVVLVLV